MKKLLLISLSLVYVSLSAQKIDITTINQVIENYSLSTGNESMNATSAEKQKKHMDKSTQAAITMQTVQTLYQKSLEDVSRFNNTSKNCQKILLLFQDITREFAAVIKLASKNPTSGIANGKALLSISQEVYYNIAYFVQVVSNGKTAGALPTFGYKKDGSNLLSVKDRILATDEIVVHLSRLLDTLVHMKVMFMYHYDYAAFFKAALPFESFYISNGANIANDIINQLK